MAFGFEFVRHQTNAALNPTDYDLKVGQTFQKGDALVHSADGLVPAQADGTDPIVGVLASTGMIEDLARAGVLGPIDDSAAPRKGRVYDDPGQVFRVNFEGDISGVKPGDLLALASSRSVKAASDPGDAVCKVQTVYADRGEVDVLFILHANAPVSAVSGGSPT